jgi:hypothetical protein
MIYSSQVYILVIKYFGASAMDDFTIVLPSNVRNGQADNKNMPSSYVTQLARTVNLEGQWEVAATRLQYKNTWCNLPNPQVMGVFLRNMSESTIRDEIKSDMPEVDLDLTDCLNKFWATDLKDKVGMLYFSTPTVFQGTVKG